MGTSLIGVPSSLEEDAWHWRGEGFKEAAAQTDEV
jgi:hypothetical protein